MADLIYAAAPASVDTRKFDTLYRSRTTVAPNTEVFHNAAPLTCTSGTDTLTLLGSAAPPRGTTETYLQELLENFGDEQIARVKTELAGQWILAIRHDGFLHLFSDFLQIRTLYYAPEEQLACSSFDPLHQTPGEKVDSYKCFEFLAMRHCLYPVWLGNTTSDARIRTLRGFEYLKIDLSDNSFEVKELTFTLDNTKIGSLDQAAEMFRTVLERLIDRPEYHNRPVHTTITGGFDSRLVSALVRKQYPDTRLRIGTFGQTDTFDLQIARRIAGLWHLPLDIYTTDRQRQMDEFFRLTDGLTPTENAVITELVRHAGDQEVGFGGVMGTEILMSLPFERIGDLIAGYTARARGNFDIPEAFSGRFAQTLKQEFSTLAAHYLLPSPETAEKDLIRLFMATVTARFSAPQVAAYDIWGRQIEPLATYPALAAALRIPYLYMGGKGTFGGFYLVPKTIMRDLDSKAALLDSTHFTPMYPFCARSFFAYVVGKWRMRRALRRKIGQPAPKSLCVNTPDWTYRSTDWAESFVKYYLPEYREHT